MWDILNKIREIRTHLQAGDYLAAARLVHEVIGIFLQPQPVGAAPAGADLDAIEAEWEGCGEELAKAPGPAVGAAPAGAVGLDPTFWVVLIQTFGTIIAEWIRRRRAGG